MSFEEALKRHMEEEAKIAKQRQNIIEMAKKEGKSNEFIRDIFKNSKIDNNISYEIDDEDDDIKMFNNLNKPKKVVDKKKVDEEFKNRDNKRKIKETDPKLKYDDIYQENVTEKYNNITQLKDQIFNITYPDANNEEKQEIYRKITKVNNLLKKNRYINKDDMGLIIQNPPINIDEDMYTREVVDNEYLNIFDQFISYYLAKLQNKINKYNKQLIYGINIQVLYLSYSLIKDDGEGNPVPTKISDCKFYYSKLLKVNADHAILKNTIKPRYSGDNSGYQSIIVGYKIIYNPINNIKKKLNYRDFKAYSPNNDTDFHKMTCASTTIQTKLCIYQTFCHITGKVNLKNMRKQSGAVESNFRELLKKEGDDIYKSINNGELVNSLELLTKKYNTTAYVVFYGSLISKDEKNNYKLDHGIAPFKVDKGIFSILENNLSELDNKMVFLYHENYHVAPCKYIIPTVNDKNKILKGIKKSYSLDPINLKTNESKISGVLAFDFETFTRKDLNAVAFNACIYGDLNNKQVKKSYYGLDCVDKLVNYLYEISDKTNHTKTKTKKSIKKIHVYGFNNSNFDNLILLYLKIKEKFPKTSYIFSGSSIKFIEFSNIKIFDVRSYYTGSLKDVAEAFSLTLKKTPFPYLFPNEDNLNYIGPIPEKEKWTSSALRKEFEEINNADKNYIFDLKKICEDYCMNDCEMTYLIAKKHLENCVGELKICTCNKKVCDCTARKFNVEKCVTAASISLKLYQQVFLNERVYASPETLLEIERETYKGGRTEVFKHKYERDWNDKKDTGMKYYDINSSYPASMRYEMPFKFIGKIETDQVIKKVDELIKHYIYIAKSTYVGKKQNIGGVEMMVKDPYIIPNLLIREKKSKSIVAVKNTDFAPHWGCELIEAMNNGFEIEIKAVYMYSSKDIFAKFANYFYNERLKIKKTNPALATFYKLVMNSLYGKFAQKVFDKSDIVNSTSELFDIIDSSTKILTDFTFHDNRIIFSYSDSASKNFSCGNLIRFSSYIAAESRCRLSVMMRAIGHKYIYYCDTDSIFTTGEPPAEFISQTELGKWKNELGDNTIEYAMWLAKKTYMYQLTKGDDYSEKNTKIASKGVDAKNGMTARDLKNKANKIETKGLNPDDFKSMLKGNKISVENDMFIRSKSGVKIIKQTRNVGLVETSRLYYDNCSSPFNSVLEWKTVNKIFSDTIRKKVSAEKALLKKLKKDNN